MSTPFSVFALIAGLCVPAGFAAAADDKKPDAKPADGAAADWTKFVVVAEVQAEIVKVEKGGGLSVTIPGPPQFKTTGSGNGRRTVQVPGKAERLSVVFAEGGLVRWSKLPPKFDNAGKKLTYAVGEVAELKKPLGTPGYAADRSDLKVGQILGLVMVRPREIPAAKATTGDWLVKRATILGESEDPAPAEKKKKP